MRIPTTLALALLLAPGLASANSCKHEENRELPLDLDGITHVRFEVNSHELRLEGVAAGAVAPLAIRACASDPDYLPQLVVESTRSDATLTVRLERRGKSMGVFFSPTYANLAVQARLPAGLDYTVDVGSGEAVVAGVSRLDAEAGSGEIEARGIANEVRARVGSGDLDFSDIGSLDVASVGSGDLEASRVRGDVRIGSVGSGDADLDGVGGSVRVGRIGSGDLEADDIGGDLTVERVGSGDVDYSQVRGQVTVPSDR